MKKSVLLCAVFIFLTFAVPISVNSVFALNNERIEFTYNGRVFNYELSENIKTSERFDLNYEINKYSRFSTKEERIKLFKYMLDIGFDKSVALEYIFPNLDNLITKIEKNMFVSPKDAELNINSNREKVFNIKSEVVGISLDREKLYDDLAKKFLANEILSLELPIKKTYPEITREYYERFTNLRADFSTDISRSNADRKHNVKTALNSLNKLVILPNETFSFNKTTGRRTKENGYRTAKIIVNNEYVDGVGGGVCQVSTTLYNALLLAGLDVREANKHSKQVSYVRYGFDAMVNYGSSDLKFYNNTNEKITIITNYSPTHARVRIYGEKMGDVKYKLTNEISDIVEPDEEIRYDEAGEYADRILYDDEYFYLKRGSRGMKIKSYRDEYKDGKLIEHKLIRTDRYNVENAVKIYGTKKRTDSGAQSSEIIDLIKLTSVKYM